jgi:tectonin beta-propeller repeat-containing protein 1
VIEGNGSSHTEVAESWRIHILDELKNRLKGLDFDISLCEKAIEK